MKEYKITNQLAFSFYPRVRIKSIIESSTKKNPVTIIRNINDYRKYNKASAYSIMCSDIISFELINIYGKIISDSNNKSITKDQLFCSIEKTDKENFYNAKLIKADTLENANKIASDISHNNECLVVLISDTYDNIINDLVYSVTGASFIINIINLNNPGIYIGTEDNNNDINDVYKCLVEIIKPKEENIDEK